MGVEADGVSSTVARKIVVLEGKLSLILVKVNTIITKQRIRLLLRRVSNAIGRTDAVWIKERILLENLSEPIAQVGRGLPQWIWQWLIVV